MEDGVTELKAKVQTHSKSLTENEKQFKKFQDRVSDNTMGIRNEITTLVKSFETTNTNMGDIDELVAQLKDNAVIQKAKEQKQEKQNADVNQKVINLKNESQEFQKVTNQNLGKLTLLTEFADITSQLKQKFAQAESETREITNSLKSADDQLQELIDRVETIETHGVQQNKPVVPVVSALNQEICESQEFKVDLESSKVGVSDENIIDPKLMDEIKVFSRDKLEKYEAQTRLELFNTTLEHFEKLKQKEIDLIEKNEREAKVETEFEYGEEIAHAPIVKAKPALQYDFHIPSQIQKVFEKHVMQVGDHIVWLETIKPKFVMDDGRLQLGSDYGQVYAHLEVQTFQQQQLLKNQNQDSLVIRELRKETENLKNSIKDEGRRIDQLEDGCDIDISHMSVEGAGLKELFRTIQDMKTDILNKSVSNEQIKNIQRDFDELRRNQTQLQSNQTDQDLKVQIQQCFAQMAQFPTQLNSLQIQLMKSETLCYDVDRSCQTMIRRVEAIEAINNQLNKDLVEQTDEQNEETLSKMKEITALKYYCSSQFVSVDAHNKFTESTNNSLSLLDAVTREQLANKQKVLDTSKIFRESQAKLANLVFRCDEMTLKDEQMEEAFKKKVPFDIFDEELGFLKHMITNVGKGKKAVDTQKAQSTISSRVPPAGGGMSTIMRNQIKEMVESVERHEQQMKCLDKDVKELNLAELLNQVTLGHEQLPQKVDKTNFNLLELKLTKDIVELKSQMRSQLQEADKVQTKVEKSLNDFQSTSAGTDEQFDKVSQKIFNIHETISQMKFKSGGPSLKTKLTLSNSPQNFNHANAQNSDDESENVTKLKQDFSKLQKDLRLKQETIDNKFRLLMPLVDGGSDEDKKGKPRSDLENRLSGKIVAASSKQSQETLKLRNDIDELKRAFEEKIRRQSLVQQKKGNKTQADDVETKSKKQKKPQFLAQQMTRELVLNGRLPQFESYGDHIARYGKGFSQMLNMAMVEELPRENGHQQLPRLVSVQSLGEMSNSYDYETPSDQILLGGLLTSPKFSQDALSQQTNSMKQKLFANTSHPEIKINENAPTLDSIITTPRVHPSTKALVYKKKREDQRQGNITIQVHPINESLDQESWKETGIEYLPMISTQRSITQVRKGPNNKVEDEQ